MPIENPNTIDIIAKPATDALNLLITDSGDTPDPAKRMQLFKAKLVGYIQYIAAPEFEQDYPGVDRAKVTIILVSRLEATEEMKDVAGMRLPNGIVVPVKFHLFQGEF